MEIGHKLIAAMKQAQMPPVCGFVNGVALTPFTLDFAVQLEEV